MKFINASQEPEKEEKEAGSNRLAERRMTISALSKDKNKTAHGETVNLEKQFKVRFQGLYHNNSSQTFYLSLEIFGGINAAKKEVYR